MARRNANARGAGRPGEARARIAHEAARLIREHGYRDPAQARRKAAERLGIGDESLWPRASEVEQALHEHQRLFRPEAQAEALRVRREAALAAMRHFAAFEPRVTGAVLDGTADAHSVVVLHLHADDALAVHEALARDHIPFEARARRVRTAPDRYAEHPLYAFTADGIAFELVVLPRDALRQPPLDREGGAQARASASALEALMRAG